MREYDTRFSAHLIDVKSFGHHQENVNVIRVGFGGDVTAKDDEAFQLACGTHERIDTLEVRREKLSLQGSGAESRDDCL
jgi:hypothetical protein